MKQHYTFIGGIAISLGIGFTVWKIVSKPLPTPDRTIEIQSVQSENKDPALDFQELRIGDRSITPADLQWELDLHIRLPKFEESGHPHLKAPQMPEANREESIHIADGPELRERIVSSVIERKVLYRFIEEKARGFDLSDPSRFTKCVAQVNEVASANPEFFSAPKNRERLKTKLCEQAIIEQYLDEQVFRPLTVTDEEVGSYYRTHEKNFRKPARVILRQVVLAKEDTAEMVRKEIKPHNFAELAKKYSIAPEAAQGGLIGPFSKEQLPTLFDIVFSMDTGEISGIVKSEYGFHIIMPVQRIAPQTLSLSEATPEIRAELMRTKKLAAFQKWLNTALNAVSVTSPTAGISQ